MSSTFVDKEECVCGRVDVDEWQEATRRAQRRMRRGREVKCVLVEGIWIRTSACVVEVVCMFVNRDVRFVRV